MKEERFFFAPQATATDTLPDEEAAHVLRVLRYGVGDQIRLMDGNGYFYIARITEANRKVCRYELVETVHQSRQWTSHIHIAMAPTKNMDRTEWFVEKAVEIGVDAITFLDTDFSERKKINLDRLDKIAVSAMKQSHKAYKPILSGLMKFSDFLLHHTLENRFVCHCYNSDSTNNIRDRVLLKDHVHKGDNLIVMVGPEGDFSIDEVRRAESNGFIAASLGNSRLRTETAALVAVHIMNLFSN